MECVVTTTRGHRGPKPIPIWARKWISPLFCVTTFPAIGSGPNMCCCATSAESSMLYFKQFSVESIFTVQHLKQRNGQKTAQRECTTKMWWFHSCRLWSRKNVKKTKWEKKKEKTFHFARGQAHACLISRTYRQYIRLSTCFILQFPRGKEWKWKKTHHFKLLSCE